MSKYYKELEALSKYVTTACALSTGIEALTKKYGVIEKVIKQYANGIKKVAIYDKDGLVINEYHK